MAYRSLREIFYADASSDRITANELLAAQRLNSESTFRTGIETPHGELFLAVPRELSLLNEQVLRHERRISLATHRLPPIARSALVRNLVVNEVVSTNDMEGVHSTRRQISDTLAALESTSDREEAKRFREFVNLYLGISDTKRTFPASPADIRAIYDLVMRGEQLGKNAPDGTLFRKGGVDVWDSGGRLLNEGPYPESAIVRGMEQMLSIVNSAEIPETYSAIVGHYVFEYVHPFYDGNGRTGRYLLALYLSRPLSVLTSLSLSRVIAQNRNAYYKSFVEVEHKLNHAELTPFVLNVLSDVQTAQNELDTLLDDGQQRLEEARERLTHIRSASNLSGKESEVLILLVQLALFAAFPDASLRELARFMGVKSQQARKYMTRLEETGIVNSFRDREKHYVLSDKGRRLFGLPDEGGLR